MFEVDVKNMMEEGREEKGTMGEGDQLRFGHCLVVSLQDPGLVSTILMGHLQYVFEILPVS